jgi:hypothetical protein
MSDVLSFRSNYHAKELARLISITAALLLTIGCGTTREQNATQQLVMSDAVDKSVQYIDFRPLSDQKVYLDNSYLRHVKGEGFVNSEYVTSALRQQIVAAGCLIQDSPQDADIIVEARLGVLGSDDHRVTFGLPENNAISSAISLLPDTPAVPAIPELAFARRDAREAAAKIVAFAYHRETRKPIWQSGVQHSMATARDTWVLGIGPFQSGSIRDDTKLAGSRLRFGEDRQLRAPPADFERPDVDYTAQVVFQDGWPVGKGQEASLPAPIPGLSRPVRIAQGSEAKAVSDQKISAYDKAKKR